MLSNKSSLVAYLDDGLVRNLLRLVRGWDTIALLMIDGRSFASAVQPLRSSTCISLYWHSDDVNDGDWSSIDDDNDDDDCILSSVSTLFCWDVNYDNSDRMVMIKVWWYDDGDKITLKLV